MNPSFEPNQSLSSPGNDAVIGALLRHVPAGNTEIAPVSGGQQLLLPTGARAICEEMGLNWWAALKLREEGFLSFSPENTARLDEAQEAELRFVGGLVIAGCDRGMLEILLQGLPKPYAYDHRRLYYDWRARQWRVLPEPHETQEAAFANWLETLVQKRDIGMLTGIDELARDALARVRAQEPQQDFQDWNFTSDGETVQG